MTFSDRISPSNGFVASLCSVMSPLLGPGNELVADAESPRDSVIEWRLGFSWNSFLTDPNWQVEIYPGHCKKMVGEWIYWFRNGSFFFLLSDPNWQGEIYSCHCKKIVWNETYWFKMTFFFFWSAPNWQIKTYQGHWMKKVGKWIYWFRNIFFPIQTGKLKRIQVTARKYWENEFTDSYVAFAFIYIYNTRYFYKLQS